MLLEVILYLMSSHHFLVGKITDHTHDQDFILPNLDI